MRELLGRGSTIAEPAAANDGVQIFMTGNTHASYSLNGGTTWTNVPIPAGPAYAPFACCDLDVIYDQSTGTLFWTVLYTNASLTNSAVRLFVRRTVSGATCSYIVAGGSSTESSISLTILTWE